jgi:hypothetical protein
MTGRIAPSDRATLARSSRSACGLRYSGSSTGPVSSSSTIAGTPSRNTEPHQNASSSNPPTIGPMIAPTTKHPAQTATALARCRGSRNRLVISDRVEGVRVAPAIPSSAREAISIWGLVDQAARTEASPNAAAPTNSSRRRPIRSPTVPMVIRKPATMNP